MLVLQRVSTKCSTVHRYYRLCKKLAFDLNCLRTYNTSRVYTHKFISAYELHRNDFLILLEVVELWGLEEGIDTDRRRALGPWKDKWPVT